jgi:hypothetical protein
VLSEPVVDPLTPVELPGEPLIPDPEVEPPIVLPVPVVLEPVLGLV